jgi:hypothetical protein
MDQKECLPIKGEALSSNFSTTKTNTQAKKKPLPFKIIVKIKCINK